MADVQAIGTKLNSCSAVPNQGYNARALIAAINGRMISRLSFLTAVLLFVLGGTSLGQNYPYKILHSFGGTGDGGGL